MEWTPIDSENLSVGEVLAANFKIGSPNFRVSKIIEKYDFYL